MLMNALLAVRAAVWIAIIVTVVLLIRWFKSFEPFSSEAQATQVNTEITLWVVVALVLGLAVDQLLRGISSWARHRDTN